MAIKLIIKIFILAVYITNLYAEDIYIMPPRTHNTILKDPPPVSIDSSAIRDQYIFGNCYAEAAAALMDYYICKDPNLDLKFKKICKKKLPLTSSLYLNNISKFERNRKITEKGHANLILMDIEDYRPKLVTNQCAPYDKYINYLLKFNNQRLDGESLFETAKRIYLKNNKKKSETCKSKICSPKISKAVTDGPNNLGPVGKLVEEISKNDFSFEKGLFKKFIPQKCFAKSNTINVSPQLKMNTRRGRLFKKGLNGAINYKKFYKQVRSILKNKNPIILEFKALNGEKHCVLITGIKIACDKHNDCKTLFKIQNSYGKPWQDKNNDGWLLAKPLVNQSLIDTTPMIWMENK